MDYRTETTKDLPHGCQIALDLFMKAFLPTLPDDVNIKKVTALVSRRRKGKENPWVLFKSYASETGRQGNGSAYFANLATLFGGIVGGAQDVTKKEHSFRYACVPNSAPETGERSSKHRPDALFLVNGHASSPYSYYSAPP